MQGNDEENEEGRSSGLSDAVSDGISGAKKAKKALKDSEADAAAKQAEAARQAAQTVNNVKNAGKAAGAGAAMASAADDMAKAGEAAAKAGKAAADTGEAAASAGAGAASGGITLAIQAVIEAIKGTGSAISDLATGEDSGFSLGSIIGIPIATLIFVIYMFSFYATTNSSGQVENYQEAEYARDVSEDYSQRNTHYIDGADVSSEKINQDQPYLNALTEYKNQTDEALKKAFLEQAAEIVQALDPEVSAWNAAVKWFLSWFKHEQGDEFEYDAGRTVGSFYSNPYPYSLKINESEYYSIGDYLRTNGFQRIRKKDGIISVDG